MRLTILLNGPAAPVHDFAVLWLDTDQHRWSRESHDGIDLPKWGTLHDDDDATRLYPPGGDEPLCTLRGLRTTQPERASGRGDATWSCATANAPTDGIWRLQAVERAPVLAENALFGGERAE